MIVSYNVDLDEATPHALRIRAALSDRRKINQWAAGGMLPLVQRNLLQMNATNHNALGAPSKFWSLMYAGTKAGADDQSGYVAMPRAVALRYFGGTVTPKVASYLAIPARTESYGKSPKDFNDLRLAVFSGGTLALVQVDKQALNWRRRNGELSHEPGEVKGGLVFYWLVSSATIRGNANVLPTLAELQAGAVKGISTYLRTATRPGGLSA